MRYKRREIEIMLEYYSTGGFEAVRRKLRGRTRTAIYALAHRLGIQSKAGDWSASEDAVIAEHYPDSGPSGTAPFLPSRTIDAIIGRASAIGVLFLGIPVPRPRAPHFGREEWTSEQDRVVIDNYPKLGAKRTAVLLPSRTHISIRQRAFELGVRADRRLVQRVRYVDQTETRP